ncbi:MAG: type I methionyl aminopeptidase [Patescibacteria group bacterium]
MNEYYTKEEIIRLREGGKALAQLMRTLGEYIMPGISVHDIEMKVRELIADCGGESATIGYSIPESPYPFPSAACISINDGVVHGIAYKNQYVLQEGDVVSVDVVMKYQGIFVDICRTWGAGKLSKENQALIKAARDTTDAAIRAAQVGNTVDDIGKAAEKTAQLHGFNTVRELGGHGVGKKIHMLPFIPNFAQSGFKDKIKEGMVLAIEPIVTAGDWRVKLDGDGWLFSTRDGSNTAQFEETVLVTKAGPEILTQ